MKYIFTFIILALLCACHTTQIEENKLTPFQQVAVETLDEVIATICERHFDSNISNKDWSTIREKYYPKVIKAKSIEELGSVLNQLAASIGHSHVAVMPPEDPYARSVLKAKLENTPIPPPPPRTRMKTQPPKIPSKNPGLLGLRCAIVDTKLIVTKIYPNTPAAKSKIRTGDQIYHAGKGNMPIFTPLNIAYAPQQPWSTIFSMITTAPVGNKIPLFIISKDSPNQTPKKIVLKSAPSEMTWCKLGAMPLSAAFIDSYMTPDKIAYISFSPCLPHNTYQVRRAIQHFTATGMKGLIIDLRGNPGGIGVMSGALLGHLVDTQTKLVNTSSSRIQSAMYAYPQKNSFLGPVAVLIDGGSGSSSEIFAAAIQDTKRGKLYGQKTVGACLGSNFIELKSGYLLQTVEINLTRLNGSDIEGVGVSPDVQSTQTYQDALKGIDTTETLAHEALLKEINGQ